MLAAPLPVPPPLVLSAESTLPILWPQRLPPVGLPSRLVLTTKSKSLQRPPMTSPTLPLSMLNSCKRRTRRTPGTHRPLFEGALLFAVSASDLTSLPAEPTNHRCRRRSSGSAITSAFSVPRSTDCGKRSSSRHNPPFPLSRRARQARAPPHEATTAAATATSLLCVRLLRLRLPAVLGWVGRAA